MDRDGMNMKQITDHVKAMIRRESSSSFSEGSISDEDLFENAVKKPQITQEEKNQHDHYKGYNIPEMLRSMSESCHKTDNKYCLGSSTNWRGMWTAVFNIVAKRHVMTSTKINRNRAQGPRGTSKSQSKRMTIGSLPPIDSSEHPPHHDRDHSDAEDDEVLISSSGTSRNSHSRCMSRKQVQLSTRRRANMIEMQRRKAEYVKMFHNPVHSITDPKPMLPKYANYGSAPNKDSEVIKTLKKIGKKLEKLCRRDRSELIERGNVELVEPTALRLRLKTFLDISVTPREVECLFEKFDPNNIGSVNLADVYGNALGLMCKKKTNLLSNSRRSSKNGNSTRGSIGSEYENWNWSADSSRPQSRDIIMLNHVDEKLNPIGDLDGNITCSVQLRKKDKNRAGNDDIQSKLSPERVTRIDFSRTVRTDIHEEGLLKDEYDRLDLFPDPPTPDHGMGSTQNIREYNTLAESDSINSIFLCKIDEDNLEDDEQDDPFEIVEEPSVTTVITTTNTNRDSEN